MDAEERAGMTKLLAGDEPCGANCEYDELFLALETLAAGEEARVMGDSVIDAKDPDWRGVRRNTLALWEKTRDLRVAVYFALSALALDGFAGFADGLEIVKALFADAWEGFWPRLDPDDDNDPLERMNVVSMLSPAPGTFDDPIHFLTLFRRTRLVPTGPTYTLRDLLIAEGELEGTAEKVDAALLNAEITGVPADVIAAQAAAVERIAALTKEISDLFAEKTGSRYALSFQTLTEELKPLRRFYVKFNHDAPVSAETSSGETPSGETSSAASATAAPARTFDLSTFKARNRSEALSLLKKGCEYFRTAEPTSPVPYLVERALRMADMNFMDLLAEIDPSGADRGRDILGVRGEGS